MYRIRPLWIRALRLYQALDDVDAALAECDLAAMPAHAYSRFRSTVDPRRFAQYSMRDGGHVRPPTELPLVSVDDHTLVVVREFRRVPLDASGLALMIFTARGGTVARVVATLAQWVEPALSLYQPSYLLLARSLEQPRISVLLAGVHERRALQGARPSPLSVETVLPELSPLLDAEPERYAYCPDDEVASRSTAVSPHAV